MGNATSTISPLKAAFHPEWEEDLTEGERRDWEERKIKVKISGPEENGTEESCPLLSRIAPRLERKAKRK